MSLKGFAADEVKDIYARALELCREQTSSLEAFMAQWFLGLFYYFRAEMRLCDEIAAELIERADHLDDLLLAGEAGARSESRSWTRAGLRLDWGNATGSPRCAKRSRIVRRGPSPDRIPRSPVNAMPPGTLGARVSRPSHGPHQPCTDTGHCVVANRNQGDRDDTSRLTAPTPRRGSRGTGSRRECDRTCRRLRLSVW